MNHAFSVNRISQRVDYAPEHLRAYRNADRFSGTFTHCAFNDVTGFSQKNDSYSVLFDIHRDSVRCWSEHNQFTAHAVLNSFYPCNTITDAYYLPNFFDGSALQKGVSHLFP